MTIRRLILLSTTAALLFLAVLLLTLWSGFRAAKESSQNQNTVALPALVAMLETRFSVVQVQQYLTDVSATGEADGFKEAKAAYDNAIKGMDIIARLESGLSNQVTKAKEDLMKFHGLGVEMANAYNKGGCRSWYCR